MKSTDMASVSSNYPSTGKYLSKKDVSRKLQHSRTFSWCLYRKRDIIRHVGIVIVFDGEPFCTVDFAVENPKDPSWLLACPSLVLIERAPRDFKSHVDCGSAIQFLRTDSEDGRQRAKGIIDKLVTVTPNQEHYSLVFKNCRHNTKDVLDRVCDSEQCNAENLENAKEMLQNTKLEDNLLACLIVILARVLGNLKYLISYLKN